jgi:hypothetical protein
MIFEFQRLATKMRRTTMVGEGGDSDTLGDDHPQYLVASGTRASVRKPRLRSA